MMNTDQKLELIAGLRNIATFLEQHPNLPINSVSNPRILLGYLRPPANHSGAMREWAQAMGEHTTTLSQFYLTITKHFGPVGLDVACDPEGVCPKVVTTKEEFGIPDFLKGGNDGLQDVRSAGPDDVHSGTGGEAEPGVTR